jgi:hypothetical protein
MTFMTIVTLLQKLRIGLEADHNSAYPLVMQIGTINCKVKLLLKTRRDEGKV